MRARASAGWWNSPAGSTRPISCTAISIGTSLPDFPARRTGQAAPGPALAPRECQQGPDVAGCITNLKCRDVIAAQLARLSQ